MKTFASVPAYLLVLILLFVAFILFVADKAKKTKQALAEYYHISRKTLANWIVHFQTDIVLKDWNNKRKLSTIEYLNLTGTFGTDTSLVSNKKTLAAITGSTYKVLSENVKANLDKIGITLEAWESCNCFPPTISSRIIKTMNGEFDEWSPSARIARSGLPKQIYFNDPPSNHFLPSNIGEA